MVEFVRQQLYAENFSAYIIESSDVIFCGFDIVQILDDIIVSLDMVSGCSGSYTDTFAPLIKHFSLISARKF